MALPLAAVPIIMNCLYAFALVGGPVLHDLKTKSTKPNDIYAETTDVKDTEDGYLRIIVVVQKKSWLRTAKFSTQSYVTDQKSILGATAVLGTKINEAICGDISGSDSLIQGIKYQLIKVKLEAGKNYVITYGKVGALNMWTFASSTFKINAADIPKVSGKTHYVYFDEDGYFASGDHFYKANQLFK